jgi:hypothetical protein
LLWLGTVAFTVVPPLLLLLVLLRAGLFVLFMLFMLLPCVCAAAMAAWAAVTVSGMYGIANQKMLPWRSFRCSAPYLPPSAIVRSDKLYSPKPYVL